jgi:hypothetical protein
LSFRGPRSSGLVVAGEVDVEFAQEFAGGGVDDAHVVVLGEQQDVGSGVGSADADVAQAAGDAQGDRPGFIDLVGADAIVGVMVAVVSGGRLGSGAIGGGRGGAVRERAVRPLVVVDLDERVEQGLELDDRGRWPRLCAQPVLEGLLEAFDAPMFVKLRMLLG